MCVWIRVRESENVVLGEKNIRKSWGKIAPISVLITLPISITVIAWRVSLSFLVCPALSQAVDATQDSFLLFTFHSNIQVRRESKNLLVQMCSERKNKKRRKNIKRFSLALSLERKSFYFCIFDIVKPRFFFLSWKERKGKERKVTNTEKAFRLFLMLNTMVFFMLRFHCYVDVQILLSHSILFNIETISYWSLRKFSHFFCVFSYAYCYYCYFYGAIPMCSSWAQRREKFIKVKEKKKE